MSVRLSPTQGVPTAEPLAVSQAGRHARATKILSVVTSGSPTGIVNAAYGRVAGDRRMRWYPWGRGHQAERAFPAVPCASARQLVTSQAVSGLGGPRVVDGRPTYVPWPRCAWRWDA